MDRSACTRRRRLIRRSPKSAILSNLAASWSPPISGDRCTASSPPCHDRWPGCARSGPPEIHASRPGRRNHQLVDPFPGRPVDGFPAHVHVGEAPAPADPAQAWNLVVHVMETRLLSKCHGIFDRHAADDSPAIESQTGEWNQGSRGMDRLMAERYREVWVAETQPTDEAGNPTGPLYKGGLTPEVISAYPELDWMIEADQNVASPGTEENRSGFSPRTGTAGGRVKSRSSRGRPHPACDSSYVTSVPRPSRFRPSMRLQRVLANLESHLTLP